MPENRVRVRRPELHEFVRNLVLSAALSVVYSLAGIVTTLAFGVLDARAHQAIGCVTAAIVALPTMMVAVLIYQARTEGHTGPMKLAQLGLALVSPALQTHRPAAVGDLVVVLSHQPHASALEAVGVVVEVLETGCVVRRRPRWLLRVDGTRTVDQHHPFTALEIL